MTNSEELIYFDSATSVALHARLAQWFGEHARALPWRETNNPYAIWLSEVILQQTQVVQGMSYYHKFLDLFPTIADLASASEDEVLRAWQGLGYYSRGRNLLKAAQMVMSEFGGVFPSTLEDVKRLPGVGPYTQAAILSFAFNKPYAAVDGNVYRVLSRLCADATPIDTPQGQKHFRALATELLSQEAPGLHNQAMIELGALVCTPRKPDCLFCPVSVYCQSYAEGSMLQYPVKQGKIKVTNRYLSFFLIELPDGTILLERRPAGDIWQGLYQFPLLETQADTSWEELSKSDEYQELMSSLTDVTFASVVPQEKQHRLTHRLLHAKLYRIKASSYHGDRYQCVPMSELDKYGLPILLHKLIGPTL